jgi:hypothetical protein
LISFERTGQTIAEAKLCWINGIACGAYYHPTKSPTDSFLNLKFTLSSSNQGGAKRDSRNPPKHPINADDLIHAMTQLIDEAHTKGVKVIGATLTPYGGANYARPD